MGSMPPWRRARKREGSLACPRALIPQILHMECKDTGEFAHRESTEYEQTEVFNKEVVSTEHGNEEYVHLKSQHDEYVATGEMRSDMPTAQVLGVERTKLPQPRAAEPTPYAQAPQSTPFGRHRRQEKPCRTLYLI